MMCDCLISFIILFLHSAASAHQAADHEAATMHALANATPALAGSLLKIEPEPPIDIVGVSAVASDQSGNLYILQRPAEAELETDPIVVLDREGKFLRSWGRGMFEVPHSIRLDRDGNVWTIDAHTSIARKFTSEGEQLMAIEVGGVPDSTRRFCGATDIAFGENGRIYIADGYCNARVLVYASNGTELHEFGQQGTGPGQFKTPHGIGIGPDGNVYVADRENGRIQWFTPNGHYLGKREFGGQVHSVAFSAEGEIFVPTKPRDVPPATPQTVYKIDLESGMILGKIDLASHELGVAPDGALLGASRAGRIEIFLMQDQE